MLLVMLPRNGVLFDRRHRWSLHEANPTGTVMSLSSQRQQTPGYQGKVLT